MAKLQYDEQKILAMVQNPLQREAGFRMIMAHFGRTIYWHIRRMVVSHEDAQDALQETSINIWQGLEKFNADSAISTWVYRIATNEALRVLRRRTFIFQSVDALGDELVEKLEADPDIDAQSTEAIFQKAVLKLPTQQRLAFNLRYYDELPYEEIAKITGKNVSTLKTNYHLAVTKLKSILTNETID